jgi:predicted aspartyl protease
MSSFRRIGRLVTAVSTIGITVGMTGAGLTESQAIAQSCYMVNASGQRVSLGTLCGEAPIPDPPTLKRVQPPTRDGIYRARIKRRLASTPVIDVSFNGKTFEMIFDTGASNTLITRPMAEALRLNPKGYREVIIADGSTVKFPITTIDAATSAGLPPRKLNVTVAENADIGLLGHDFFARYDVKIKRNVIEFQPQTE